MKASHVTHGMFFNPLMASKAWRNHATLYRSEAVQCCLRPRARDSLGSLSKEFGCSVPAPKHKKSYHPQGHCSCLEWSSATGCRSESTAGTPHRWQLCPASEPRVRSCMRSLPPCGWCGRQTYEDTKEEQTHLKFHPGSRLPAARLCPGELCNDVNTVCLQEIYHACSTIIISPLLGLNT